MTTTWGLVLTGILALAAAGCGKDGGEPLRDAGDDGSDAATSEPDATPDLPISLADPVPEDTLPGEYGCDGCPDDAGDVFEVDAGAVTSVPFSGTVLNAVGNGVFWVSGANGQVLNGPIPTAGDGTYSFTAPVFCGEQLVKCVWSNESGKYVRVVKVVTTDCVDADIRVTISWDDQGRDWELHLIKPGGTINDNLTDCTWTSCISSSPDWGVPGDPSDDPHKDVDNTGNYGPENVFLSKPEAGTYTVMVEHWGAGQPSTGQAIFNVAGSVAAVPMTGFVSEHVWTAGTIDWPSGQVRTSTQDIDCSGMWSGGCRMSIP